MKRPTYSLHHHLNTTTCFLFPVSSSSPLYTTTSHSLFLFVPTPSYPPSPSTSSHPPGSLKHSCLTLSVPPPGANNLKYFIGYLIMLCGMSCFMLQGCFYFWNGACSIFFLKQGFWSSKFAGTYVFIFLIYFCLFISYLQSLLFIY